ncbi:MAG: ABC transporter permease [Thermoanaerobaculia bacterium]
MRAINRKLLRDVMHLRGQLIAVALVVMCGIATWVTMRGAYQSLLLSQDVYYREYRFADVFAHVERAPLSVAEAIGRKPSVVAVQPRIVYDVTLDIPGLAEPATGRLVSIPDNGRPRLNDIHIRTGRWIDASNPDEIIVSEAFALSNKLKPGDSIAAILNGRWRQLRIVGIGLSPEFVYEIKAGDMFPDPRRFGVLWIGRQAVQNAFSMEGAFNDLAIGKAAGASTPELIENVDAVLAEYGGTGAYDREEQISNRFLSDEIKGTRVSGNIIPAIFLGVAAFLVHIVMTRLVQTQRDQIAVLKAFGYTNIDVGLHYLGIAFTAVATGSIAGALVGTRLMYLLAGGYKEFYHFPIFRMNLDVALYTGAIAISAAAAAVGALVAVRGAVSLPPAEAMRPEAPPQFHAGFIERSRAFAASHPATRIVVRNIIRRKAKSILAILGVAVATAILVVGRFMFDAVDHLMYLQFQVVQREDVAVPFLLPRPGTAIEDLRHVPGVLGVEPYRAVAIKLSHENYNRRTALLGVGERTSMRRLILADGGAATVPPTGIVLNTQLASILHVREGDRVTMQVLEGRRPVLDVPVSRVIDEMIGIGAYMDIEALRRILDEGDVVSGGYLMVDPLQTGEIYSRLKQTPAVAGVAIRQASIESFKETIAKSMAISNFAIILFACVIAAGVIYNGARIALSERARELASLRVLGFTRAEVSRMLIGEQAILTAAAIPFGFVLGYALAALLVQAYESELYRIPLVVSMKTYAFAFIVIALAAAGSSLVVLRRIKQLDLVEVLKTRE